MIGAPVLAGTAALRMGSGLVQIAVPRDVLPAALSITPELIGLALAGLKSDRAMIAAAEASDAVVIGPGMGLSRNSARRLKRLIHVSRPMVIDADALNWLAAQPRWPGQFKPAAILTPHPGEMKRLAKLFGRASVPTDDAGRLDIAVAASRAFGQVVVLKGYRTVVTNGRQHYINTTGDSSLSKAGTGDVLSGILGCLLGQGMNPFDAAMLGVHLHGSAGTLAGRTLGMRSVLARDVIEHLSVAIRKYG
jgi:NAD(P)H-hydrate epimerase